MARLRPACPARVIHPRVIKVPAANPAAAVVAEQAAAEKVAAVQPAVMNLYREAAAGYLAEPVVQVMVANNRARKNRKWSNSAGKTRPPAPPGRGS